MENNFQKYLDKELKEDYQIINNYRNKRFVFKEENYYIKKYIFDGKQNLKIRLGLKKDPYSHYEYIREKIEDLGINVAQIKENYEKKETFFESTYVLVMEDEGIPLTRYKKDYKNYEKYFKDYFDIFIKLCQNKIYPKDYNLAGYLIKDGRGTLIDLDAYKTKKIISKRYKKKLLRSLGLDYSNKDESIEYQEFIREEAEHVRKTLGW